MLKKFITLLSIVTLLAGCEVTQRQNATTGETETNSATKGALIGAVSGIAVGLLSGDNARERRQHALIGAAGGAAIGGGIGYYFDRQEAALRKTLLDSGVQVQRISENQLLLRMKNGIGFETNSYQLTTSIHHTLQGIAKILVAYPNTSLVITGHTDSTGSYQTNQQLSEQRASAVRQYLIAQGVAAGRAIDRGLGERVPLCSNQTVAGRTCNRRVEIQILPLK